MTDKELQKLSRSALLEMLLEQSRENDRLRAQVENWRDSFPTASSRLTKLAL